MRVNPKDTSEWTQAEEAQYERYSKLYDQRAEKLQSRGEEMWSEKYTRSEWYDTQIAYKNTWKEEGHTGKLSDVNKDLVRDQTYEVGDKQAKAMRKAEQDYIKDGNDFTPHTYKDIRQGKVKYSKKTTEELLGYDFIGNLYHQLRAKGMSVKEAQKYIAYAFFGSD